MCVLGCGGWSRVRLETEGKKVLLLLLIISTHRAHFLSDTGNVEESFFNFFCLLLL